MAEQVDMLRRDTYNTPHRHGCLLATRVSSSYGSTRAVSRGPTAEEVPRTSAHASSLLKSTATRRVKQRVRSMFARESI